MDAFLASDGLWDVVEPSEVWKLIDARKIASPSTKLAQLEQDAIAKGSRDNISMIYVRFVDE